MSDGKIDASSLPVAPLQVGEPSSFFNNDWWSPRDWHKLTPDGFGVDIACEAGSIGELAIAGVSLRGHKHRVAGQPNEDSFAIRTTTTHQGEEFVVLVLCDGLSSASHSAYAARRTAALVADLLRKIVVEEQFTYDQLEASLGQCLKEFVAPHLTTWPAPTPEDLPAFGCPDVSPDAIAMKDLLVTLTIALVPTRNGDKGASEVFLATIGDSPAFILTSRGEWIKPSYSDTDDVVLTTATAAFPKTTDAAWTRVMLYEGDCLCLTSDGVGNFIKNNIDTLRLGAHFAKVWQTPRDLSTLVRDVSFDLRSADDDRTVILCWTNRAPIELSTTDELATE